MSYRISLSPLLALAALTSLALSVTTVSAQNSTPPVVPGTTVSSTAVPGSATQSPAQLTPGVADVLRLSQAQVGDDVIVSFIKSSGRSYGGMSASEIAYLHQQGVSDQVVTAMLNQPKQVPQAPPHTAQQTQVAPAPAPADVAPQLSASPTVTYSQPAAPSTVYVVPSSPTVDYGYYPSYGYYGYPYPALSFSFGFGGGYWGGHYYGHGGGYHGGGYYHGGGHGGHR
jgi:hypothetical protein